MLMAVLIQAKHCHTVVRSTGVLHPRVLQQKCHGVLSVERERIDVKQQSASVDRLAKSIPRRNEVNLSALSLKTVETRTVDLVVSTAWQFRCMQKTEQVKLSLYPGLVMRFWLRRVEDKTYHVELRSFSLIYSVFRSFTSLSQRGLVYYCTTAVNIGVHGLDMASLNWCSQSL